MDRTLFAGVAKRDITIADVGPDRLLDPLFVRTLVLDDGVQQFAILALDAVAIGGISDIPDDFLARFRAAAETRFGIPADLHYGVLQRLLALRRAGKRLSAGWL